MRKLLVLLALLLPATAFGGTDRLFELSYDDMVSQCENRWFVVPTEGDGNLLGFAYVDAYAGPSFRHYGSIGESKGTRVAIPSKLEGKAVVIERIEKDFRVSCLEDSDVASLGLPDQSDWIANYKDKNPPGEHHERWAYWYNHIGASRVALEHVMKAIEAGYDSPDLTFEHGYALNALERYDEAVALLTPAAQSPDCPADTVAELAYAYIGKDELAKAIEIYERAYDAKEASQRRWEFASNIAGAYDRLGDQAQAEKWRDRANKLKAKVQPEPARF